MRLSDFKEKIFEDFNGIYNRGDLENVPEKYLYSSRNIDHGIGELGTRPGTSPAITLGYASGKVNRFTSFITSKGIITLILDESGNLYTSSSRTGDSATTPRLTVAGATDFAAIQMLGHIFIAFNDGIKGLAGTNLKIFIPGTLPGADEFRDAAGRAPYLQETSGSSGLAFSTTPAGASRTIGGTYFVAICYITTSGFITPPGLADSSVAYPTGFDLMSFGCSDLDKITISNLPIGPAGTAKRQILITKVGHPDWTPLTSPAGFGGGMAGFFFLASEFGGIINDNVTTTVDIDFNSNTDLLESADYLFDLYPTIPAPLGLQNFNSRLVMWGKSTDRNIIELSDVGEPENIDPVDNVIIVNKDDGFNLSNGFIIRNIFYACTELGIYAIVDNGDIPTTWQPVEIDKTTNVPSHGVASFFHTGGIKLSRDWTLLVTHSGIALFNGSVQGPPITDNIDTIWKSIDLTKYHKIILSVDEDDHKIYCIASSGGSGNNLILVGDYNSCAGKIPSLKGIKWATWVFYLNGGSTNISDIGLVFNATTNNGVLFIASDVASIGKIFKLDPTVIGQDNGHDYDSFILTSALYWLLGAVHTYNLIGLIVYGTGTLNTILYGLDDKGISFQINFPSFALPGITNISAMDKLIKGNIQANKAIVSIGLTSGHFNLNSLRVYGNVTFPTRPA